MKAILSMRPPALVALQFLAVAMTAIPFDTQANDADARIDEIIVSADFRERSASELSASISVFDSDQIEGRATQHFEELIDAIPNLNWSGDGHRARYLQIRGIGELEQYQGAPNPSVGFLIDDIDFSGIGGIATLFDLQRIEVLRGPQGSRYGANALAGLIYMQSQSPTPFWDGRVTLSAASDNARAAGVAFGGPLVDDRLLFRVSAHQHKSDGFRDNPFLRRRDTNGRDETAFRGKLRFITDERWQADLTLMLTDADNGYDAFALDNGFTVLSDKPGRDAQRSIGTALRLEFDAVGDTRLVSITSFANSDIDFDFDADWGNDTDWAPFVYDFESSNARLRETINQEFRLFGEQWLAGVYALRLREDLQTQNRGNYLDPIFDFATSVDDALHSDFAATSVAVFGQFEQALGAASVLTLGLRGERRDADYIDSSGLQASPSESMWGGELSLRHEFGPQLDAYATLSKGYKAGGFNLGPVPDGRRTFGAEELMNLELGLRTILADDALALNIAAFANRRNQQQVRTAEQLIPGDPASFVFFTDNIARGESLGLEAELNWQTNDRLTVRASLGLLDASFRNGREQAHAPDYTAAVSALYRHPRGFFASIDLRARDEFFFDVSHDQRSQPYQLLNARIGYESQDWRLSVWTKNLLDERYAVRGFYFGNEPPDFPNTLYTRLGDPRQIGISIDRYFAE